MISSINRFSGLAFYLGQTTSPSGAPGGTTPVTNTAAPAILPDAGAEGVEDDLTYSPYGTYRPAHAATHAAPKHGVSTYEQAMPTRPGFSAGALADAIIDPGKQTISAGKTSAQVAQAARAAIDANVKKMSDSGQPFDANSKDDRDFYSAMGTLDRRALNAVANNSGGLFSKDEQQTARQFMTQQEAIAAAGFAAPDANATKGQTPSPKMSVADAAGYAAWLDKVSPDEKSTIGWVVQRAIAQNGARGSQSSSAGRTSDSTDPRVALVAAALRTRSPNAGVTGINSLADLQSQPWMKPYNKTFDAILKRAAG